jgi:transcriptional regulator GlxA family with amidase domain
MGLSLEKTLALKRYRKALRLVNSPMPLADVAAAAGYFDQAHFTHRFSEYSGISPSNYRHTPRTGADTLHLA